MVNPVMVKNMVDANKDNREKEKIVLVAAKQKTAAAWDEYEKGTQ